MASIDIIEEVRKNMGYGPLPKIDPNTQEPESANAHFPDAGSAVIPALLVGFYKHTRDNAHAAQVMAENDTSLILEMLFGDEKDNIIRSVANYAGVPANEADTTMTNA